MIFFIKRIVRQAIQRQGVSLVFLYVLLLIVSSFLVVSVEPSESGLNNFPDALWWSVVTSTTVGYGDIYPVSIPGRIIAVALPMFLGIGIGAAFITHLASSIIERRDRKMTGEIQYRGRDHIAVVGVTEETTYLIEQILKDDGSKSVDVVLVADLDHHPLPEVDNVSFVKGKPESKSTLQRANIGTASRVVIHTGNDDETLFALINVMNLKKEDCDVTVRCISTEALETFRSVPGTFEVIIQMTAEMLVQAMHDKAHIPLQVLLTNDEKEEIYYITVPAELPRKWRYWELHNYLKEAYDFLTFAVQTATGDVIINPAREMPIGEDYGIWLIAASRPAGLDWTGGALG